jgi:hypothetical protein
LRISRPLLFTAAFLMVWAIGPYRFRSTDGTELLVANDDGPQGRSVWVQPIAGGSPHRVGTVLTSWGPWGPGLEYAAFAADTTHILYSQENDGRIEFFDFATGEMTPIFGLEKPVSGYGGLTISPDGKSLLYCQTDLDDSYIMLVKNFR